METMMRLILDGLYCLVALLGTGMNGKKSTTASRWNPSGNK